MKFDADTVLTFGKYKEETVEEVLKKDPSYLVWAADNIEWFELDKKIYNKAKRISTAEPKFSGWDEVDAYEKTFGEPYPGPWWDY